MISFYTPRPGITNTHASLKFVPSPFDVISIRVSFRLPRRAPANLGYSRGGWVSAKSIDESGAASSTNQRESGESKSPFSRPPGDGCSLYRSCLWCERPWLCVCLFVCFSFAACLWISVCVWNEIWSVFYTVSLHREDMCLFSSVSVSTQITVSFYREVI